MCATEVKQTSEVVKPEGRNPVGDRIRLQGRDPVRPSFQGFLGKDTSSFR